MKSNQLVSFQDQSESYVHGFESGMYSVLMEQGVNCIERDFPVHTENKATIQALADYHGYIAHWKPFDDCYTFVTLIRYKENLN